MAEKKTARRCCSTSRANVHYQGDADSIAQQARAWHLLPIVFGITFALMCAWTIIAGV